MLERERCSPLIILERSYKTFAAVLMTILAEFAGGYEEGDGAAMLEMKWVIAAGLLGIMLLMLLFFWLQWRCTYLSAADDSIIYESGVFFKKKISVPISKINTIDKGQNLFQRVVETEVLKIDTGAIAGAADKQAEINLLFSVKRGDEIREYILSRQEREEELLREAGESPLIDNKEKEPDWSLRAGFWDFFMYGLTSSGIFRLLLFISAAGAFVAGLSDVLLSKISDFIQPVVHQAAGMIAGSAVMVIMLFIVGFLAVLFIISNIAKIIWAAVRFYDFRVARDGDNVVIRYGAVSLKNYTLPVRNIHAVKITQNIWQQMLKKSSIEVITIGYGNESEETALLFPIISNSRIEKLLADVLPEYLGEPELHYSGRRGVRYNVFYPAFVWLAAAAAGAAALLAVFSSPVLAIAVPSVLYVFILARLILAHSHTAVGCSDRAVDVQSGGFRKTRTHIRLDAVQSVTLTSGIFKRRRNISNLVVAYHAPAMRSNVSAKSFDNELLMTFADRIED